MTAGEQQTPRRIAVVTGARSDFAHMRPVMAAVEADPRLALQMIVTGSHLSAAHGRTIDEVLESGFAPAAEIECLAADDGDTATASAIGRGVAGFAEVFADLSPDWVVLLGDRYEIFAAATAATAMRIPLAHLAGGECDVASNIDFQLRNAITQMALLHFVSCEQYRRRVVAMGQEDFRIHVVGIPSLDGIADDLIPPDELGADLGVDFSRPTLLATVLPVTLNPVEHEQALESLLVAIAGMTDLQVIFTGVNADAGGRWIADCLAKIAIDQSRVKAFASLGARRYHGAMAAATAVAGNSSSGVIETPSFGVPTVNIGTRQDGRLRAANVIDVEPTPAAVAAGLRTALTDEDFRRRCRDVKNPLGDGRAGRRIAEILATVEMDDRLLRKALPGAR